MATKKPEQVKRIEIPMFEGVNTLVGANVSKKQELSFCTNARSNKIGLIEKRKGTRRLGSIVTATANYGIIFFDNSTGANTGFFRVSTVAATTSLYYLNTSAVWTALAGSGTNLSAAQCDFTIAEGNLYVVNGTAANRYVSSDGVTVITSATTTGNLYLSPIANKINYYKDRLYVADYTVGATNYVNSVMMSSMPLGIVSLVDGDHASGSTTIEVTDTKYIHASDTLQVYRGTSLITTLTVTAKAEYEITVNATGADIKSADELWVNGTYSGTRVFRWAGNPSSGENVKKYDTFKLSGWQNDRIKMMVNINDVMMIGNNNNLAIWNNSNLRSLDLGIGCISDNGYAVALGELWFVHYTGIYKTTGGMPQLMSSKVEEYIKGATKAGLEAAAVGRQGMSIFISIGDVTLYYDDGSIMHQLSDVCLEWNKRQQNWYVHTGIKATEFRTYPKTDDADRLEYATTESAYEVFEFLHGNTDNDTTENREILFRADTDNITLGRTFERICYPLEIIVEAERGNSMQVFVSLDNSEFYQLKGDLIKGCVVLKVTSSEHWGETPPRCRRIRVSIRDFTKNQCKISRLAINYIETSEEEEVRRDTHE